MATCKWPIPIGCQVQHDPFDSFFDKYMYPHIPRRLIDTLSFMQKELLIQYLLRTLMPCGFMKPPVAEKEIDQELVCHKRVKFPPTICMYSKYGLPHRPFRAFLDRYCDIREMQPLGWKYSMESAFGSHRALFLAIHRVIHRTKWDLNLSTIHSMFFRMGFGPKWLSPVALYGILTRHFAIDKNTVLVDALPNLYEKAVTATMCGCKYATLDGSGPPSEMASRIGLIQCQATEPYDLTVFASAYKYWRIGALKELREKSTRMLAIMNEKKLPQALELATPTKIVEIRGTPGKKHYALIYS